METTRGGLLQKDEAKKKVMELSGKYGLSVDPDALIEHTHQCGFSGPVFTQKGMDLTLFQLQGNVIIGNDPRKRRPC